MKKKVCSLLTAVMVLVMGTTVFAAPSPDAATKSTQETYKTVVAEGGAVVSEAAADKVAEAVSTFKNATTTIAAAFDLAAPKGTVVSAENPYVATFTVPAVAGIGADDVVIIKHWNGTAWETINPSNVDRATGKITASFTSLSPIVVLVEKPAGSVSPKTADTMPVLPILAVICIAGIAVCGKKVRA